MDSYSGSVPRRYIPFRLGTSLSKKDMPNNPQSASTIDPSVNVVESIPTDKPADSVSQNVNQSPSPDGFPVNLKAQENSTENVLGSQLTHLDSQETILESDLTGDGTPKVSQETSHDVTGTKDSTGLSSKGSHSSGTEDDLSGYVEGFLANRTSPSDATHTSTTPPRSEVTSKTSHHFEEENKEDSETESMVTALSTLSSRRGKRKFVLNSPPSENNEASNQDKVPKVSFSEALGMTLPHEDTETSVNDFTDDPDLQVKEKAALTTPDQSEVEAIQIEATPGDQGPPALSVLASSKVMQEAPGLSLVPGLSEDEAQAFHTAFTGVRNELSVSSRTLIKENFSENPPLHLSSGHATVSFSEPQVGAIVRAVSEETTIASYKMMKDILLKAAKLRDINERKPKPWDSFRKKKPIVDLSSSSEGETEATRSSHSRPQCSVSGAGSSGRGESGTDSDCTPHYARSPPAQTARPEVTAKSPGVSPTEGMSLAHIQQEVRSQSGKGRTRHRAELQSPSGSRRRGDQGCPKEGKMLTEECLRRYEWARIFVTGPMDPAHNKYRFYCQICKYNVSMFSRGAGEIPRHYKREKHLRKDQKWRYVNLVQYHPISKVPIHQVRGWNGKVLDHDQLQRELPLFENAPLVDIGPKLPLFEDFLKGIERSQTPSEARAKTQLTVFAKFLSRCNDLAFLRDFWSDVATIVNHQVAFSDYDWSKDSFSVSIIFVL